MTLRSSDLRSESDLDSIRNSCDVFLYLVIKMTKCQITHFATHIFSETVTIFVEAQPQGTENGS